MIITPSKKSIKTYSLNPKEEGSYMIKRRSWYPHEHHVDKSDSFACWIIGKDKVKAQWGAEKRHFALFRKLVNVSSSIHIELDEDNFYLPSQLKSIADVIEQSKFVVGLNNDWDDSGAQATNAATFKSAINFLILYSKFIFNKFNTIIDTPDINITRDGSIYIQWETAKGKFLIIFKKNDNALTYYYAEEKGTDIPIKSAIQKNSNINEILALWMQTFLN